MTLAIAQGDHPNPVPAEQRAAMLADPQFGRIFSDHMVRIHYTEGKGWHNARLMPHGPLSLDPATAVLHYAQEIFEGMKAYRLEGGEGYGIGLFRPEVNARRFNRSARRMAMPELPEELFIEAVMTLVRADAEWLPAIDGGSLYVRPFMFASEVFLGVKPSADYHFLVIASPVGHYFKSGAPTISLWVSDEYTRAARGGTGEAKCGGNYAASLIAQREAVAKGFDQVVFLDALENRWIEELGGMNLVFVFADGSLSTPPLSGTILAGLTRDTVLTLAREQGLSVREERYAIDQWEADARSGRLTESFACGTAAVVTPVGRVTHGAASFTIGGEKLGPVTSALKERLIAIQHGAVADDHGWVVRV